MARARDQFDNPKSAEQLFDNTLRNMNTGERLSIHASVDRIIGEMEMNLDEIRDEGKWNGGMSIREGQRQEIYQVVVTPLLRAAQDAAGAVSQSRGYRNDFEVEFAASGRTETVNLPVLSARIEEGFNMWLQAVSSDEHPEMADVALPLAINDRARLDPSLGIRRMTDVLMLTDDGYVPKRFVANSEAMDIMAKTSGDTVPAIPGMDAK